jgi:hypothetical protein
MTNESVKHDSQDISPDTREKSTPLVTMHVGRSTVQIDSSALRRLIETLRARLSFQN